MRFDWTFSVNHLITILTGTAGLIFTFARLSVIVKLLEDQVKTLADSLQRHAESNQAAFSAISDKMLSLAQLVAATRPMASAPAPAPAVIVNNPPTTNLNAGGTS